MAKVIFICKHCTEQRASKDEAHKCCSEKRAAEAAAKAAGAAK